MFLWSIFVWILGLLGVDLSDDVDTGPIGVDPTMSPITDGPTSNPMIRISDSPTDGPTLSPITDGPTLAPMEDEEPSVSPMETLTPPYCGCFDCTELVRTSDAFGESCGDRIQYLANFESNLYPEQEDACRRVAEIEYPTICGGCDPGSCDGRTPDPPTRTSYCGCDSCSISEWKSLANPNDGLSCEARITWLQTHIPEFSDELAACHRIAQDFPSSMCASACDPANCGWEPPINLYCFPEDSQRVSYEWGPYLVQVKEREELCDPGLNKFGPETVSFDGNSVTLRFARVNGQWQASEVRIVLLDGTPYQYGTFRFVVDEVLVRKVATGEVVSSELPQSLVFGAFTWDDTDDFGIRENYNKEIDVELSRWNDPTNADAQFLVQPDGLPQKKRFFTGLQDGTTAQGGQTYEFTWSPGSIEWSTTAGGGQTHNYTSQDALEEGREDLVQCLPANVEVRLNLWNMLVGQGPPGLALDEEVIVRIGEFTYEEMSERFRAVGEGCSKDCQCEATCDGGLCSPTND